MRTAAVLLATVLLAGCAESNLIRGTATDRTPPAVTATEPADGAQNVTDARITVTFSEPMATQTVQVRTNPTLNLGTPTWSNADRTVTFVPSDLRPNTPYTVTVTGRDRAGNELSTTYTFRFTTGSVVQAGTVVEGLLRGRVLAGADERVYALFVAYVVGLSDRAAGSLTEDQRALREQVERAAPAAVQKVREFLAGRPATPGELAEYALWLGPDLRVLASPRGVGRSDAVQPSPAPTPAGSPPASPAPTASPSAGSGPGAGPASPAPAGSPTASPLPSPTPSANTGAEAGSAEPAAPATQATAQPAAPTRTATSGNGVVRRLAGLDAVVRELYAEAKGQELWAKAREAHEREASQLRDGAEDRLRQAATYLRLSALPFERLVVVPNLLAPRDSVAEVRVGGDLHVFVGPAAAPNVRGVVRAFLRAVAAPLVGQYRDVAAASKELFDLVKGQAEARGWEDWDAVVRESLVRAVEARLLLPNPDEQSDYLEASFGEGLILVRHFAQRLVDVEQGRTSLARFVEDSLRNVNTSQLRQQWQGRRR